MKSHLTANEERLRSSKERYDYIGMGRLRKLKTFSELKITNLYKGNL